MQMRIAQITDIHLSAADERPHGVDTRGHFLSIMEVVLQERPDQIVFTGDLCYREAVGETYAWIAEQLRTVPCPVSILAGNHDNQQVLQSHFPDHYHAETAEIFFQADWGHIPVYLLDTARGRMSEKQYNWFASSLPDTPGPVMLFMHHPPLYCGVPHMDEKYAFREIPRIQELLQGTKHTFHIFCGHYHVERSLQVANQSIHITPSTFFQIDSTQTDFGIDHRRPGYRMIQVEGADVSSACRYLSGLS